MTSSQKGTAPERVYIVALHHGTLAYPVKELAERNCAPGIVPVEYIRADLVKRPKRTDAPLYWVVKLGDQYAEDAGEWTGDRRLALRFRTKAAAKEWILGGVIAVGRPIPVYRKVKS